MFYVNQDLNYKIVNTYNFPTDTEMLPLELALTKKWLILGLCNTQSLRSGDLGGGRPRDIGEGRWTGTLEKDALGTSGGPIFDD